MSMINLANGLTAFRLLGALLLAFVEPLSVPFYVIYSLCGVSDALDGPIARRRNTAGEFGARLDSVADLTFYTVVIVRLLPVLWEVLPRWIWFAVGFCVGIRLVIYTLAAIKFHRFSSLHTLLNKLTGATLFVLPYLIRAPFFVWYCILLSCVAGISGAEELCIHILSREYTGNGIEIEKRILRKLFT